MAAGAGDDANVTVRIEDIIQRIRRDVEAASRGGATEAAPADADALPPVSSRPELEYLNRHWSLFDPLSEMRSHRRFLGSVVLRFKWTFRRLVIGVLDRYFEKERLLLLELVRFNNALAERSDRLLREADRAHQGRRRAKRSLPGRARSARRGVGGRGRVAASGASPRRREARPRMAAKSFAPRWRRRSAMGSASGCGAAPKTLPADGPILVLGCGAGDVLEALREKWPDLRGVESSDALVRQCRARGFAVERAALPQALESLPEASLAGLVVPRLADRYGEADWPALVAGTWRALRPRRRGRLRGHSRRVRPPFLAARAAALRDRRSARLSRRGLAGDRARDRRPPSPKANERRSAAPPRVRQPAPAGQERHLRLCGRSVAARRRRLRHRGVRRRASSVAARRGLPILPRSSSAGARRRVGEFAHVVYQMGNNLHHRFVLELAREMPGILVLHDVVLHHLYEGIAGVEDAVGRPTVARCATATGASASACCR